MYRGAYPNELYHYGVEGMRWGVRRYQNPDGSLTAAGRRRYAIDEARSNLRSAKRESKDARREYNRAFGLNSTVNANNVSETAKATRRMLDANKAVIKYKRDLKLAKSKNEYQLEKRQQRFDRSDLKRYGLPGSYKDLESGGKGTDTYVKMVSERGESYANRLVQQSRNQLMTVAAVGVAASVGMSVVSAILSNKLDY